VVSQPPPVTEHEAVPDPTRSVLSVFAGVAATACRPVAGSAATAGVPGVVVERWVDPLLVDSELPEHPVAPDAQCAPADAFGELSAAAPVVSLVMSLLNQPRPPPLSRASRTFEVVSHPPALAWQCALLDASPFALAASVAPAVAAS
jgi:hypothetical protein